MDYQDNDDYGYDQPQSSGNSAVNGLKIAIAILMVVLIAISVLYWQSVRRDAVEIEAMKIDMQRITVEYAELRIDMDTITFTNTILNDSLQGQRHIADSLMNRMKRERNISYRKIKAYEKELGTLRVTMQGFVRTIDSLNQLNRKLAGENLAFRREISDLRTTTEAARETAAELNSKIKRGAVIRARDISLRAVNKNGRDVSRARTASQLITTFVLAANELSIPGEKNVYVRIISPDGYDLAESQDALFEYEGNRVPYSASRVVDYDCEDLAVNVFYSGKGLTAGQYTVHVYIDGHMVGSNVIILK